MPANDVEDLEATERERAWTVAGVAQADLVQQVFDEIDRAVRDGTTFDDFKTSVGSDLEDAWGEADSYRIETIFRTNVMSAYNEGRYAVMTAPTVQAARPYWRFDAVMDDRTSDICEELDGTVLPADDDFWSDHHPPLHHACRSILTPLTSDEADEEGVDDTPETQDEPADGFGQAPTEDGEDWAPDLAAYDDGIAELLAERLAKAG